MMPKILEKVATMAALLVPSAPCVNRVVSITVASAQAPSKPNTAEPLHDNQPDCVDGESFGALDSRKTGFRGR